MKNEVWLYVTAGQGPVECALAVVKVIGEIESECVRAGVLFQAIEIEPGPETGTANSALVSISGVGVEAVAKSWEGTVQWVARSPFRKEHRRRNWFVGVEVVEPVEESRFVATDILWETMRASGPGGQHVNRTESAVRVTHRPTGLQAVAQEERSQHRNRKLALARLAKKIADMDREKKGETRQRMWRANLELERGNAVRVLRTTSPTKASARPSPTKTPRKPA